MLIITYYAPIYFEAALGHSATKAGLDLLGLILSMVIMNIVSGLTVRKIGKYTPFLIVGPMVAAVGIGLLFTVDEFTKFANVIGYEILCGVGIGSIMQLGMLGAQAEYAKEKEKMGRVMGVLTFIQMLGGVVGLAVAGAVFNDELRSNLQKCEFNTACYCINPADNGLAISCTKRARSRRSVPYGHPQCRLGNRLGQCNTRLLTISKMGIHLRHTCCGHSHGLRLVHQESTTGTTQEAKERGRPGESQTVTRPGCFEPKV